MGFFTGPKSHLSIINFGSAWSGRIIIIKYKNGMFASDIL